MFKLEPLRMPFLIPRQIAIGETKPNAAARIRYEGTRLWRGRHGNLSLNSPTENAD